MVKSSHTIPHNIRVYAEKLTDSHLNQQYGIKNEKIMKKVQN